MRLIFARANAEARGVTDRIAFRREDARALNWIADAAFWDPSRRTEAGRRVSRHGDLYEPPLTFLEAVRAQVRGGCVKLSPALPDAVFAEPGGQVEFLSERGECREAAVFFGEAMTVGQPPVVAVLLPERIVLPAAEDPPPVAAAAGTYVHDPDPAVVRAGALGTLAGRISAALIDAGDVYLTSDAPGERPLVSSYRVLEALPYRPKALRAVLRERGIGRLIVKKRRFAKEPEEVARELGVTGRDREAVLIIARAGKGPLAILCEPAGRYTPSTET